MFKSERREIKRRNSRKMVVNSRSVFAIKREADKRTEKAWKNARDGKRISPMSL